MTAATVERTEFTPGPCERHRCPCGWFRDRNTGPDWRRRMLDHPLYGPVTNDELVLRDIAAHDCDAATGAHCRALATFS